MKNQEKKTLKLIASTVIAANLMAVEPASAPNETDARLTQARAAMVSAPLAEVPDQASSLVARAEEAQRAEMVRVVMEGALEKHPTSTYATVKAVLKVAPDQVRPIMQAVMTVAPKQMNAALRAVLENESASFDVALQVIGEVAPSQLNGAKAMATREQNTGRIRRAGEPPLFVGTPTTVQQTTVHATRPPKRQPHDYPLGP